MDAITLLRDQLKSAHDLQEATMSDVTTESAHFNDTSKALPVAAAYAHSVMSEDMILATLVTHGPKIADSMKVVDVGLSEMMPSFDSWPEHEQWIKTVKMDLPKFKAYAQKVYTATDNYVASLKEEDLQKELDMGAFGKHTVAFVLTNFFIIHIANLTGEISAAKGIQGLKGYPF